MQSNFEALDFELTDEDMQKLSSLKFQKRLVDGSMVRRFAAVADCQSRDCVPGYHI